MAMNPNQQFNDDVVAFAEHLGLTGVDTDLFYESYYQLDNESYEQELIMEECSEYF